ncbi:MULTISPECIES: hypothetical protein [unclassified Leifsonia]|uniref:hypothetical protein n=1 Tax=unclassified Leifsonia TaxID=2663824 RepID=UPI0008A74877|nr:MULTISPECIES: hypothetical protein [unclassified Leifsonia]SEI12192.1 hypothetical protein SAMN04515694_11771 [Leifsonia sp. CL154]SFL93906.1 hypothetical protein SAMN04515692_1185 [Leifsonia sp. CL147]
MSDQPTFDPRRKAAIRDLVVTNAAATPGRAGGRKRTALIVTLVLLAVSISGGTVAYALGTGLLDPKPVAVPTETATPTASETPTPTPTPTPEPTVAVPSEDPTDPSTWVLGFDQVAGVHVGQSVSAVAAAAGLVPVDDTVDCPPGFWNVTGADTVVGISLLEAEKRGSAVPDPTLTYAAFSLRDPSEQVVAASPSTAAGIRLGSPESDLLSAYPDIQKTHSKYDETMGYTTYAVGPESGRYLVFQVAATPSGARTVIRMQSSTDDGVVDLCD